MPFQHTPYYSKYDRKIFRESFHPARKSSPLTTYLVPSIMPLPLLPNLSLLRLRGPLTTDLPTFSLLLPSQTRVTGLKTESLDHTSYRLLSHLVLTLCDTSLFRVSLHAPWDSAPITNRSPPTGCQSVTATEDGKFQRRCPTGNSNKKLWL